MWKVVARDDQIFQPYRREVSGEQAAQGKFSCSAIHFSVKSKNGDKPATCNRKPATRYEQPSGPPSNHATMRTGNLGLASLGLCIKEPVPFP